MPKVDKKKAPAEDEVEDILDEESSTTMLATTRSAVKRAASGSYKQKTLTSMFTKTSTAKGKGKGKAVETVAVTE
jgi:hypothetical protein